MHRASDMPHVENRTLPLDSAGPKVTEMNPMRVEPERCHTRVKPQTWSPGEVSGDSRHTTHRPCLTHRHIPDIIHASTNNCSWLKWGRPVTGDPHNTVLLIIEGDLYACLPLNVSAKFKNRSDLGRREAYWKLSFTLVYNIHCNNRMINVKMRYLVLVIVITQCQLLRNCKKTIYGTCFTTMCRTKLTSEICGFGGWRTFWKWNIWPAWPAAR